MSESHNATSKKCKKPLDKLHKMWYNKGVKRGATAENYGSWFTADQNGFQIKNKKS